MATKKKKKEPIKIEWNDACICMHTALRKCCDSPITSAAYNLIHLLCEMKVEPDELHPWHLLGRLMADRVNIGQNPTDALTEVIRDLPEEWHKIRTPLRHKDVRVPDTTMMYALQCTLRCFNEEDIKGMAAYLNE